MVEVGIPGASGFSMRFGGGAAVNNYFVQFGAPGALNADLDNPTTSSSGVFGGGVLALQLNVDFSAAGQLGGTSGLALGSLTLCRMDDPSLNGTTVSDLLDIATTLLGGGTVGSSYSIAAITPLTVLLNASFLDGTPSPFAIAHLFSGACP